jgi:hypothetical protein
MAGDLERFLQQAAERLAERVQQGQGEGERESPRPNPPRNVRQAERAAVESIEPEAVDAVVVAAPSKRDTNPLSELDTRQFSRRPRTELAKEIGLADERMASHVTHVTGGDVMHLRKASQALQGSGGTDGRTEVKRRQRKVSPFIEMLRQPETLRAAFIASQIFDRRSF